MLNTPFSPWPCYTEEEAAAVSRVLLSNRVNYWTGEEARAFEDEFAAWCGAAHAIALANGTLALDLALHGLGIGARNGGSAEDEVIVTPRTFIASVSCVVHAGAVPVFADVDRDSGNITADTITAALTPRTRAVLPVHLAGWPCDMDAIMKLSDEHGLKVIEDCAQAHGARCRGRSVGTIGHVGAWSFCQDKIITTAGEGGMVTTNDRDVWARMWSYKDHGKSWEAVYGRDHAPGYRWLHESFGTNWRMTEVQAAVGRIQLARMPEWSQRRTANAAAIEEALAPFAGETGPVRIPTLGRERDADHRRALDFRHAWYRLYAYVRPENLTPGWSRDRIVAEITARGVPCYQGSCSEVYREVAFEGTGWRPARPLPVASELGETSLMFLVHPTLTGEEIERTALVVDEVLALAGQQGDARSPHAAHAPVRTA